MSVGLVHYPFGASVSSNKDDIANSFSTKMLDNYELYPEWFSVSDDLAESKLYSSLTRIPSKNSRKELRQERRDNKMARIKAEETPEQTLEPSSHTLLKRSNKMKRLMRRWAWIHEMDVDVVQEPRITANKVIRWSGKGLEWPSVLRRMKLRTNQIKRDRSFKQSDFDHLHDLGTELGTFSSDDGSDDKKQSFREVSAKTCEAKWDWDDEHRKCRPKTLYVGNDWYQVLR